MGYKENFIFLRFSSGDFSYNKINLNHINVYIAIWLNIITTHVQLKNDLKTKTLISTELLSCINVVIVRLISSLLKLKIYSFSTLRFYLI